MLYSTELALLLNWWLLSPFSIVLLLILSMRKTRKYTCMLMYGLFFVIPTELTLVYTSNSGYVLFEPINNDIFNLVFHKKAILIMRIIVYVFTLYCFIHGAENENENINIRYPMTVTALISLTWTLSLGLNFNDLVDIGDDFGLNLYYSLIAMIVAQPFICMIIFDGLNNNYEYIPDVDELLTSQCCHGSEITVHDYLHDFSTLAIAGSLVGIIYLNIILSIFLFGLCFDKFNEVLGAYIGSRLAIIILTFGFDKCMKMICIKYPNIVRYINTINIISNWGIVLIRIQEMLERIFIIILYAPILNLNFKNAYINKKINKHYYSMILNRTNIDIYQNVDRVIINT